MTHFSFHKLLNLINTAMSRCGSLTLHMSKVSLTTVITLPYDKSHILLSRIFTVLISACILSIRIDSESNTYICLFIKQCRDVSSSSYYYYYSYLLLLLTIIINIIILSSYY